MIENTEASAGRLLIVTNIPTPYRANFFSKLGAACAAARIDLFVAYCAKTEWNRNWVFDANDHKYSYTIMPGVALVLRGVTYHINPSIWSTIKRIKPNWIVVGGTWHMPTGLIALGSVNKQTTRLLWSEGHEDAVIHRSGPIAQIRHWILRRYHGFAVPNARSAEFIKQQIGGEADFLPLPNTVDDEFFVPPGPGEKEMARVEARIDPNDRVFVQVSQLEERKGILELMAAFDEITSQRADVRLIIVGSGSLEGALRSKYARAIKERRIFLTGSVKAIKVRRWLYAADVFILVSRRDPNPLSAIEASLCGLPLMVTRAVGNARELVEDDVTGFVVGSTSKEDVVLAVERVMRCSADRIHTMGQTGGSRAKARFHAKRAAETFVETLLESRFQRGDMK